MHLHGASVPAAEILVAVTVIALGAIARCRLARSSRFLLSSDSCTAMRSGNRTDLLGLAVVQSAVALAVMKIARSLAEGPAALSPLRLVGAGIAGVGLAVLVQQVVPAA